MMRRTSYPPIRRRVGTGIGVSVGLLAALAVVLTPGTGAVAQSTPSATGSVPSGLPSLGSPRPLHLPTIVERTLPNGLKLEILEDHAQPAIWLRLALPAGSIRNPHAKVGLAQMTATLLDKGTTTRTETQIADTIDGLGASLSAGAGDDFLTVSGSGLSAYTDKILELMADITLHPTFAQAELDRARTRTLNGITSSLSEASTLADAALHRRVYGAHPYGDFTSGTPTTLPTITREDIIVFHDTYFVPNASTLFVVGDITPDQAEQKAQAAFGAWTRKELPAPPAPPAASTAETTQITLIDRPDSAQTEVRIGLPTPGYRDPNRVIGTVSTAVLGLGQFEGRLTKEIRVKRGLTYGAASFFDRHAQAGDFEITTYTKTASTGEVVKIALDEARKLRTDSVPADELQDRKDFLNGSFAVSMATPEGVLSRLYYAVLYGNGPDDLTRYVERVQAVTPAQIQEEMNSLGLDHPQIVLVGDAKAVEPQVTSLGPVTKIAAEAVDLQSPTLEATASGTAAQPGPANPGAEAEGKARLAAAIKALGGDAFLNLKSLVMKGPGGEFSPPMAGGTLPLTAVSLTFVRPDKGRMELKTDTIGKIIIASPGGGARGWLSVFNSIQDLPAGQAGLLGRDPTDLLRRATQGGFAVSALPDEENGKPLTTIDGKPAHGFSLTDDMGRASQVYIEADTGLVRRIVLHSTQGDTTVLLSDYHMTDGVALPGAVKIRVGPNELASLKFDTFQVNPTVDEAIFVRPK